MIGKSSLHVAQSTGFFVINIDSKFRNHILPTKPGFFGLVKIIGVNKI
jgi:hypothetical protein